MKLKRLLCILFLLPFTVAFSGVSVLSSAFDGHGIYVSPSGSDDADGSITSPVATVQRAKELVKTKEDADTVYLREGTYTFSEPLAFSAGDRSDVTYTAYCGERVVFTAGTEYSGFEECTVNGVKALKKYVGSDAGISVLLNDRTTLKRTRYPEKGYLYPQKVLQEDCLNPDSTSYVALSYKGFIVNKNDIPELKNPQDVLVRILHWWKDEMLPVESYDVSTGHMLFTKGSSMQILRENKYFLENVFEALNEPGEWYYDRTDGNLYYVPQEGETASSLKLWGGKNETLITVNGVNGISFDGIIFRGNGFKVGTSRDFSQAAVDATKCLSYNNCSHFEVRNCEFRDVAACAVYLGKAVKDAAVRSCLFENIGAQAVFIMGENVPVDSSGVTKNISVENNIISGYGREYFNAVAVLVIHANSVSVCNNEIHDGYYTAVSVGWVWGYAYSVCYNNKICDNLIYNIGQGWLSDMGGIYTLGNQPGTVISGNVIHNVAADPDEGGYGGWGIYLDEGSSYELVEKNLVYACASDGYHLHYGSYNTVRNNIFALNGESQVRVNSNPPCVTPADGGKETASFERNIILTDKKVAAYSYMQGKEYLRDSGNIFWDLTYGNKLFFLPKSDTGAAWCLEKAQFKGFVNDPVTVNPGFRDAAAYDFGLSDDSAAVKAGFEKWDYSQAGTLKDTTVGRETDGGATAYNFSSFDVPHKRSRNLLRFIERPFYMLLNLFKKRGK